MRARAWENLQLEGYTFGDEIGRGASSTVYSATSVATGRTFAAKMLAVEDTSIDEICVLKQLKKHPNIMEHVESKLGRDGETQVLFVISEFCPLGNIGDYVLKQQVDVPTKRNLAVQLADAITFLHKNGVVHRDIKPQNVLLTGNEAHLVLKVVDFGLAKVLTSSENSENTFNRSYMRSAVGTRFYLSPEVYQSLLDDQPCRYTPSVDIFSMGLLLWAMFDGLSIPGMCEADRYLTPFTGSETDPVPIAQAVTQGSVQLNVMETEENVQCKNLVRRMLCRDRKERPDAQEVLETLIQGYGEHRVGKGPVVVCITVDDDDNRVRRSCPCKRTDSDCSSCVASGLWSTCSPCGGSPCGGSPCSCFCGDNCLNCRKGNGDVNRCRWCWSCCCTFKRCLLPTIMVYWIIGVTAIALIAVYVGTWTLSWSIVVVFFMHFVVSFCTSCIIGFAQECCPPS